MALATIAVLAAACASDGRTLQTPKPGASAPPLATTSTTSPAQGGTLASPLALTSTAFTEGAAIPVEFTCDGAGASPPLAWGATPEGTVELVLTVIDPDAGGFVHWVIANLDPSVQALAQSQVRDLRTFLHSMRPVDVDGANLVATARRAAESFQKESGIPVTFLGPNSPVGLPADIVVEVLQMVREALHNVQKHAGATRVAVAMETTDRGLEISVDDNGHGFGFAGAYSLEELELLRLGPASLKRRARSLNADLLLESKPGRGSGIKFRIPL